MMDLAGMASMRSTATAGRVALAVVPWNAIRPELKAYIEALELQIQELYQAMRTGRMSPDEFVEALVQLTNSAADHVGANRAGESHVNAMVVESGHAGVATNLPASQGVAQVSGRVASAVRRAEETLNNANTVIRTPPVQNHSEMRSATRSEGNARAAGAPVAEQQRAMFHRTSNVPRQGASGHSATTCPACASALETMGIPRSVNPPRWF